MKDIICESFENKKVIMPKRYSENYKIDVEKVKQEQHVQTEKLVPYSNKVDPDKLMQARLTARPTAFIKRPGQKKVQFSQSVDFQDKEISPRTPVKK